MYNRYIRNDRGTYTRVTEDDGKAHRPQTNSQPPPLPEPPPPPPLNPSGPPPNPSGPPPVRDGLRFPYLDNLDTGDLLLLCLLFLLYREGADEELLVALGLLLIL
ncbi:MAG: hypothetical protein IJR54_06460 [Oscillibacter sp.]|nr:hypothetical protein [Oscillibacter sp.]